MWGRRWRNFCGTALQIELNPSGRTVALGSARPQTEVKGKSTGGDEGGRCL